MDGLLVIDKPIGPTSHDVVARARRVLGERRIGHTGTLDPLASGVLPLVVGRATRLARFLSGEHKRYRASIRLGWATDSGDAEGDRIGPAYEGAMPSRADIDRALDAFRGAFVQQPPRLSAKKIQGVRSHRLARGAAATTAPLPEPVQVRTEQLTIIEADGDRVELDVICSAGFYVRALADDLGRTLGTGAHLVGLRRTASGSLTLNMAVPLNEIDCDGGRDRAAKALIPLAGMLLDYPEVTLTEDGVRRVSHGQPVGQEHCDGPFPSGSGPDIRLLASSGDLLAMATRAPGDLLHPAVVLM